MPLTEKQRAALEARAEDLGIDPDELIAKAEALAAAGDGRTDRSAQNSPKQPGAAAKGEKPNLYMYHLPFVTVNEVRTIWLDLDPVPGGDEYAGVWAAKQGSATSGDGTA